MSVTYHSLSDKARPAGTFSRCHCRPRPLFCLWGILWHCWECHCQWALPLGCLSASRGWPGRSPRALSPPTPGWSPTRAGACRREGKYGVLRMYPRVFISHLSSNMWSQSAITVELHKFTNIFSCFLLISSNFFLLRSLLRLRLSLLRLRWSLLSDLPDAFPNRASNSCIILRIQKRILF